ncbi:MAG: membrane assembly protein AsmA, partial [Betaproteobacteria bacterium HGW-Betaproteobacteria-2]
GLDELSGVTIPVKLTGTFAKPKYGLDFAGVATAIAKKKVIDKVGGEKGEAVQKLLEGDAAGGLEGLLKKKTEPAPAEKTADPATTPPAEEKPASKEDKVKQKLDKLLGF